MRGPSASSGWTEISGRSPATMSWDANYRTCNCLSGGRVRGGHGLQRRLLRQSGNHRPRSARPMATTKLRRQAFEVYLDATELGIQQRVGTLFQHETRTDLPASFEY